MARTARLARFAVLCLLGVALALAGCSASAPQEDAPKGTAEQSAFPVTITDDASRTVTVERAPGRIVSLAPGNTEIVATLGLTDRLVGVTTYCDYPPEVKDLPKVGDFVNPNIEAIGAAKPDLVLVTTGVQADVIGKLENLGASVVAVDPQNLEDLYSSILMVGRVTGETTAAEGLVEGMRSDMADVASAVGTATPVPCFIEIAQDPLFTAGKGTLLDDLITAAGGRNIVSQPGYVGYSLEQLLKDNPEVYLATKGSMSDPRDLSKRAGYDKLASVKAGRVFVLDDNLVSRPGPRVIQGVRQIAEALHPGVFAP